VGVEFPLDGRVEIGDDVEEGLDVAHKSAQLELQGEIAEAAEQGLRHRRQQGVVNHLRVLMRDPD